MSEMQTGEIDAKDEVVLVEEHEKVEGFMIHNKPYLELTPEDISHLLRDCEKELGRPFEGDPDLAVHYVEEFLEGASIPIRKQLTKEEQDQVFFGLGISEGYVGMYDRNVKNLDKDQNYKLLELSYLELEKWCKLNVDEKLEHYVAVSGVPYTSGPPWFMAHQVGVEEGAHAAYILKHPLAGGTRLSNNQAMYEYFLNNAEYDGLLWRTMDAEDLSLDETISADYRAAIQECVEHYRYQKKKVDRLRTQRRKATYDLEQFRSRFYKPFIT